MKKIFKFEAQINDENKSKPVNDFTKKYIFY